MIEKNKYDRWRHLNMVAEKSMEKIVALAKNRGFVYPGSEIYGGLANAWDYGPLGVELKNNVKRAWWKSLFRKARTMLAWIAPFL